MILVFSVILFVRTESGESYLCMERSSSLGKWSGTTICGFALCPDIFSNGLSCFLGGIGSLSGVVIFGEFTEDLCAVVGGCAGRNKVGRGGFAGTLIG